MNSEIEAKFLNVNHEDMRARLKKAGFTCSQPIRLMRRALYDFPDMRLQKEKNGYVRLRDEGDKVTLTYKQFSADGINGAQEIEATVDSFFAAKQLLEAIGLKQKSFQESRRETWVQNGVEVVLDEWPWLDSYIEIEGVNESQVKKAAGKLGLEWQQAIFGDVTVAYRMQYPHLDEQDNVGSLELVRFEDSLPDLLKSGD